MDDTALAIYFLGVKEKTIGPVVQDKQARVHHGLIGHGNAGDVVDCFIYTGVGIEVLTEANTFRCQPIDDLIAGEIDCTIEAHVLQEVS